ncbi:hypothetical protein B0H10DRAFT_1951410 [Mycena sp. CBHHK59/15]|nr:hypothetical protein B0H10DRAFT_1951410 [Mycena sp. CBHHK59/15]
MAEKFSFELWRFLKASEKPSVTRHLNTWSKWYTLYNVFTPLFTSPAVPYSKLHGRGPILDSTTRRPQNVFFVRRTWGSVVCVPPVIGTPPLIETIHDYTSCNMSDMSRNTRSSKNIELNALQEKHEGCSSIAGLRRRWERYNGRRGNYPVHYPQQRQIHFDFTVEAAEMPASSQAGSRPNLLEPHTSAESSQFDFSLDSWCDFIRIPNFRGQEFSVLIQGPGSLKYENMYAGRGYIKNESANIFGKRGMMWVKPAINRCCVHTEAAK